MIYLRLFNCDLNYLIIFFINKIYSYIYSSHCIFTIYLESRSRVESSEKVIYSKLNLVDLAGSERLSKTQTSGITLQEAKCIFFYFNN